MDVQSEKLYLIEQLAKLEDVQLIQKIKELLESSNPGYHPDGSEISRSELLSRAEHANKQIESGQTKTIDRLRGEVKDW
ncbi:MAG: hypothetical protein RIC35_00405 [Marinoscillum sp.]